MVGSERMTRREAVLAVIALPFALSACVRSREESLASDLSPEPSAEPSLTIVTAPPAGVFDGRRDVINHLTIHHTATGSRDSLGRRVDAEMIGGWHEKRGLAGPYKGRRACAYHYVILPDGTVQTGRPINVQGSGTKIGGDNRLGLAVVLVGDFEPSTNKGAHHPDRPTPQQLDALSGLALWAMREYGFKPDEVRGHSEVAKSLCPGANFDLGAMRKRLVDERAQGHSGVTPPIARLA